jgi:hypothetical protein
MVADNSPQTCYLCCAPMLPATSTSRDHVPAQQFFPPESRRARSLSRLLTLPTHVDCNNSFKLDEEYTVATLLPLMMDSLAGAAHARHLQTRLAASEGKRRLAAMVRNEFREPAGGLVLPNGLILKEYRPARVHRVMWKIVRGLFYSEYGRCLPESTSRFIEVLGPLDQLPDYVLFMLGEPMLGPYPDLFNYRRLVWDDPKQHVWVMHFAERVGVFVAHHDPECACEKCGAVAQR